MVLSYARAILLTICVVDGVRAVTQTGSKVFVILSGSSNIAVYDADTFKRLSIIKVKGLNDIVDVVACRDADQLYVAVVDCIWRVSAADRQHYRW